MAICISRYGANPKPRVRRELFKAVVKKLRLVISDATLFDPQCDTPNDPTAKLTSEPIMKTIYASRPFGTRQSMDKHEDDYWCQAVLVRICASKDKPIRLKDVKEAFRLTDCPASIYRQSGL